MFGDKFTIIGDGKFLAIIFGDDAYVIEDYYLEQFTNNIVNNWICVSEIGGKYQKIPEIISSTLTLKILVNGQITQVPADTIKINNVENMSIFELFKAINDKIEKRNDKT